MTVTEDEYTRRCLRAVVAQVCQAIGWNSIHQGPLNIMVDVLHKYIEKIGRTSQDYAALCGRTDSNLVDVAQSFGHLGVDLTDLEEYIQHFEVVPAKDVPQYPVESADQLCFLKPGSREVLQRPIHIYEYLPPMYPELEEEVHSPLQTSMDEEMKTTLQSTPGGPRTQKRGSGEVPDSAGKSRGDEDMFREISSVMMTSSGFLSPCREGKLADSRTPHQIPDPEEKKASAKRALDKKEEEDKKSSETSSEPVKIKQEVQDFEELIEVQQVKDDHIKRPAYTSLHLDDIIKTVVDRGLKESDRLPPPVQGPHIKQNYSPMVTNRPTPTKTVTKTPVVKTPTTKTPAVRTPATKTPVVKTPVVKTPAAKTPGYTKTPVISRPKKDAAQKETPGDKRKRQNNKRIGPPQSAIPGVEQRPLKMARIPKITDTDIKLPSATSMGIGNMGSMPFGPGIIPGGNPLIPGNLYGFGIPAAHLIPGLNPILAPGYMGGSGTDDIAADDSELEEGEVSPPRSEMPPDIKFALPPGTDIIDVRNVKKESVDHSDIAEDTDPEEVEKEVNKEVNKKQEKERIEAEKIKEKEKEREREKEREKEKEREREKEKERLAREAEKQREREKEKEKEREKEREREREKEREKEKEKSKDKDRNEKGEKEKKENKKDKGDKEKKKSKKEKKEKKDKDKDKKEKKKEKKEKKNKKDKDKKVKSGGARIFNPDGEGGLPKLKIKTVPPKVKTPEPPATPKLVIKNLVKEESTSKDRPPSSSSSSTSVSKATATPAKPPATPSTAAAAQPTRGRPPKTPVVPPKEEKGKKPEQRSEKRAKRPPGSDPNASRIKRQRDGRPPKPRDSMDDEASPGIITETVGIYTDESGNMVWICPACGKQDDGSPMIGCDQCDDWYHWLCVGINKEPQENQDWFCTRCIAKKGGIYLDRKGPKKKN